MPLRCPNYFGRVHQTGEIKIIYFEKPLGVLDVIDVLASLNDNSHIYGITYFARSTDFLNIED